MHKYRIGQRVRYSPNLARFEQISPRYTVVRLMPRVGNDFSYRIKGDDEAHERVVEEAQLQPLF